MTFIFEKSLTSPIRRIADFRIHMLLDELDGFEYSENSIAILEKDLLEICRDASYTEIISEKVEEEALKMAMAKYMEGHIGDGYDARVISVGNYGMYVETNNHIIGRVKLNDMLGDRYYYNDDCVAIIGRKHKKIYHIGNKIYVVCKEACKESRMIHFEARDDKVLKRVKH